MRARVLFARFGSVFGCVDEVAMGHVGMVRRRFVIARFMMLRRFLVMPGCVIEMFGGFGVVLMRCCVFRMRIGHVFLHMESVSSYKPVVRNGYLCVRHAESNKRLLRSRWKHRFEGTNE